jgi:hypothetical protein
MTFEGYNKARKQPVTIRLENSLLQLRLGNGMLQLGLGNSRVQNQRPKKLLHPWGVEVRIDSAYFLSL